MNVTSRYQKGRVRKDNTTMRKQKKTCYDYLLDYGYFTEEELNLVLCGWGRNEKTYDTICRVRYGYDIDQLALEDKDIFLTDYNSNILTEDDEEDEEDEN